MAIVWTWIPLIDLPYVGWTESMLGLVDPPNLKIKNFNNFKAFKKFKIIKQLED